MKIKQLKELISVLDNDADVVIDDHGARLDVSSVKETECGDNTKIVSLVPGARYRAN